MIKLKSILLNEWTSTMTKGISSGINLVVLQSNKIYKKSGAIDHGFSGKGAKHRFVYPLFKAESANDEKLLDLLNTYIDRRNAAKTAKTDRL